MLEESYDHYAHWPEKKQREGETSQAADKSTQMGMGWGRGERKKEPKWSRETLLSSPYRKLNKTINSLE